MNSNSNSLLRPDYVWNVSTISWDLHIGYSQNEVLAGKKQRELDKEELRDVQKPKLIDILFRCEFQFDIAKIILTLTGHPFIMINFLLFQFPLLHPPLASLYLSVCCHECVWTCHRQTSGISSGSDSVPLRVDADNWLPLFVCHYFRYLSWSEETQVEQIWTRSLLVHHLWHRKIGKDI